MTSTRLRPLTLLAAFAAFPILAATPTPPDLAKACSACHGPAGVSVAAHIPNLAGQKEAYLDAQLAAFQSGTRKDEVMSAIAKQLSPAQRKALAGHFSSMPAGAGPAVTAASFGSPVFPLDYPARFTVYLDTHENGLRKVYLANEAALKSIGSGKPPANGATVVVENRRKAEGGAETVMAFAMMQVGEGWGNDVPELLRNGDWRYGLFNADKRARTLPAPAECLACHKPKAAEAYLFTHAELMRKAAGTAR